MARQPLRMARRMRSAALLLVVLVLCSHFKRATAQAPFSRDAIGTRENARHQATAVNLTPAELMPVLGPLVMRDPLRAPTGVRTYDERFVETEESRYADYLKCRGRCVNDPMHYGALRSRLMWAIRNGEPIGEQATDSTRHAYARGRTILKDYLVRARTSNNFAKDAHHNTAIADIEAYYLLEGDQDALDHIHVNAARMTAWGNGRLEFTHPGSDPRQVTVALQLFSAAHRLGIPYARNATNTSHSFDPVLGSWIAAGERQIEWIDRNAVTVDGSIRSPAHGGLEAYFFNVWLAAELLRWDHLVAPHPRARELAKLIIDHLIEVRRSSHASWETLPYTTGGSKPAHDLAAFYVHPALMFWQDTGDPKYREFALMNLRAANRAWINGQKQWNQTFSTLAQGAQAMLAGVPWRCVNC